MGMLIVNLSHIAELLENNVYTCNAVFFLNFFICTTMIRAQNRLTCSYPCLQYEYKCLNFLCRGIFIYPVLRLSVICFHCTDLKASLRKLEHENTDLKFLNNQYVHKVRQLEQETREKADRIINLQEKNFHAVVQTPGKAKPVVSLLIVCFHVCCRFC